MKVKVLGSRGEVEASSPYHSHHTGVLVDRKILLDLGEEEFLRHKPEVILISHLHPDHAFFVNGDVVPVGSPIFAPQESERIPDIKVVPEELSFDDYLIRSIPTHHSLKVESNAYLIKKDNQKLLFTSDMIWINKEYHHLFENLDIVITDGSFFRKGGMARRDKKTGKIYGHNGVPDLINLFRKFTHRIVFIHFGTWFYEDADKSRRKLSRLGRDNDVEVITGYDGLELDLAELV